MCKLDARLVYRRLISDAQIKNLEGQNKGQSKAKVNYSDIKNSKLCKPTVNL